MAFANIILKYGLGDPSTVLANAEPAFDTSSNILYIGTGIGNPAIPFYPYSTIQIDISTLWKAINDVSLNLYELDVSLHIISGGSY
jgi:hypothetical protein